ncbi:MAG: hypothetical protein UT64_C0032G0004 [Candidatus Falkowbacteria bacterium GW2011_GWF2_39_8]|uniref:Uncharacterized protein n=1 Tax=Candidatus Falkowbacteria bacterium GW2011_GWF2_39_8 TaxID=1618642 RepID=A0A0G0SCM5_9BACT|nr:MAG: hypothetical protein UT64_C0032G0004 [Candidatus Falkowbacteria bacterium GW2011_GWF2_39_8]
MPREFSKRASDLLKKLNKQIEEANEADCETLLNELDKFIDKKPCWEKIETTGEDFGSESYH